MADDIRNTDILFVHADSFYNLNYSLFNVGMLYIATMCKNAGYHVRCMANSDLFHLSREQLSLVIKYMRPKVIGFYTLTDNFRQVKAYAELFKSLVPCKVVLGGPLANIAPEKLIVPACFDVAVRGEGEYVMLKLADLFIKRQGSIENIESVTYKKLGRIISNPQGPQIQDLDALPFPDHSLVGMNQGFHMSTGRGCPYQCAFCFQKVHGAAFRYRSPQNIVDEIIYHMESTNAKNFFITDDVFAVNPKRVMEFCRLLTEYRKRTKKEFIFFCEGRAEVLSRHPEMMEALSECGMARLQIGIESGCQEMLRAYGKKLAIEDIYKTAELAGKMNCFTLTGNFIIGGPHETEETFERSLKFAKSLIKAAPGVFEMNSSFLTALPDTPIDRDPARFGIKVLDREFCKGMTLNDAYCRTEALDRDDLRALGKRFREETYKAMKKEVVKLKFSDIERHVIWSRKFLMDTLYHMEFMASCPVITSYFDFYSSPRFKRLENIPAEELEYFIPNRTIEDRQYVKRGLRTPASFGRTIYLGEGLEREIYEYAASKLSIKETAERLVKELGRDETPHDFMQNAMLPIYKKFEDNYQMLFWR